MLSSAIERCNSREIAGANDELAECPVRAVGNRRDRMFHGPADERDVGCL